MKYDILHKKQFSKEDIIELLQSQDSLRDALFKKSAEIKEKYVGNVVYLRGLIEYSNKCVKNCYYCGIRKENNKINRYTLAEQEVLDAAHFALIHNFASIVIQSGESVSSTFIKNITSLLEKIGKMSDDKLGITLSCGEQTEQTYSDWHIAGAQRYLLRIETSNKELYQKLHPDDSLHNWEKRTECLRLLRKCNYQVGSGVMIGLPFQTLEDLASDLLFMQEHDIDMCGMGPYVEHENTPLYEYHKSLLLLNERMELTYKMIALLRIMMKDINIAATTALQAIDKTGREKAIKIGANIMMPNITPVRYRSDYLLYQNKPCIDESGIDCSNFLEAGIRITGNKIGYNAWGNSPHFKEKMKNG